MIFFIFGMHDIKMLMLNVLFGTPISRTRANSARINKIQPYDETRAYFDHHRNLWGRIEERSERNSNNTNF